jgi:carbonic anhydrase
MGRFSKFSFKAIPNFDEASMRKVFSQAVPLKTVVIYCYDPRVGDIPNVVAKHMGEVYPGEIVRDKSGNRIGSTTTMTSVVVAAGRAVDAMRSISVAEYLFGLENIVVVHHSHCGATTFSADGIINAYRDEHGVDISTLSERDSVCIDDFEESLKHDTALIRASIATPKSVNVYGFFFDIDTGDLVEVVRDIPVKSAV